MSDSGSPRAERVNHSISKVLAMVHTINLPTRSLTLVLRQVESGPSPKTVFVGQDSTQGF